MLKVNVKKVGEFSALVLSGIIFLLAFNLLFFLMFGDFNVDLTKDKRFSLSDDTIEFLDNNENPVNIRFYVSKDLQAKNPKLNEYAEYIRKVLVEYKNKGNIDLTMVDVVPFENSQAEAERAGIKPFDFGDGVEYQYLGASFSNVYGRTMSIPNFYPERKDIVEDDITRLISIVSQKRRPTLGVVSSLFNVADENNPTKNSADWPFISNMKALGYKVVSIRDTTPVIDENIDALLVLYPLNINTAFTYALDQYLLKGGSVVMMFDAFSEERFRDLDKYYGYRSGMLEFLKKHGVLYYEDLLVGDTSSCRDVVMDAKKVKYPLKIDITGKMLANHPINKNIDKVFYNHGSYFKHNKTDGLVASVIAKTTNSSGLMLAEKMTDLGYEDLLKNYLYTDEEYTLALLLEGEFRPYYPYPPINDEELLTRLPLYIGKAQKPGKLLLIGDADIVNESLWNANVGVKNGIYDITYSSGNLRFLRNIFDYMSGSGFTNVKRKNTFEQNNNLVNVFAEMSVDYFKDKRQEISQRLTKIKEQKFSLEETKSDVELLSIKKIKGKEQLMRDEIELNNDIKKVTYLTGEKYKFFMSAFSVLIIVIIPLLMGLSAFGIYVMYNRMMVKKAKEYVDDKK